MSDLTAENIFSPEDEANIVEAIVEAEKMTSGEIRVHLSDTNCEDHYQAAVDIFDKLEMFKTKDRNGVLIYLCAPAHVLTIIGDKGINDRVPQDFWRDTIDQTLDFFKRGEYKRGMIDCVIKIGDSLKDYFPYQDDDVDELPNTISKE